MKKSDVVHSPRLSELRKRRRHAMLQKASLAGAGLAAVIALFAYGLRLPGLGIETIRVSGASIVDPEGIRSVAFEKLQGNYLWLFPRKNVLIYPKQSIAKALGDRYTRLDEIDLSLGRDRALAVSVTERNPAYTWCGAAPAFPEAKTQCYFMDAKGYIFDQAPYFSGDVYFKFYGSTGVDLDAPPGSYLARGHFAELLLLKDAASALGLSPTAWYVKDDGDAELSLETKGAGTPKILIDLDTDMATVAGNLETALATEPLKTKMDKEYAALEYIDLRFGNKVYTKFRTP